MIRAIKQFFCELKGHPYPKTRVPTIGPGWPANPETHEVSCSNCGKYLYRERSGGGQ